MTIVLHRQNRLEFRENYGQLFWYYDPYTGKKSEFNIIIESIAIFEVLMADHISTFQKIPQD